MGKKTKKISAYVRVEVEVKIGMEIEILKPIWHIDCDGPYAFNLKDATELAAEYGEEVEDLQHKKAGTTEFITKFFETEDGTEYIAIDNDMDYDCGQFVQNDFINLINDGIIKLK